VNLAQIRSAVPEIFHTQTKNSQTDSAKNRTLHSPLHAVTIKMTTKQKEIGSLVWGTPANFNGYRVLAALLHDTLVVGVSETLRH